MLKGVIWSVTNGVSKPNYGGKATTTVSGNNVTIDWSVGVSSRKEYYAVGANGGGGMTKLESAAAANTIAGYTIYEGTKNFAVQLERGAEKVLGYVPAASKHALRGLKSIPYLGFAVGVGIDYGQLRTNPNFTTDDFNIGFGTGVVSLFNLPAGGILYFMEHTGDIESYMIPYHQMMGEYKKATGNYPNQMIGKF